jgi:hypothetical protein
MAEQVASASNSDAMETCPDMSEGQHMHSQYAVSKTCQNMAACYLPSPYPKTCQNMPTELANKNMPNRVRSPPEWQMSWQQLRRANVK